MTKRQWIVIGIIGIALVIGVPLLVMATGTWNPELRIGWAGSNYGDHIDYGYTYFEGDEENSVDVGDSNTLTLDYDLTVDSGSLELRVLSDNDTELWQKEYDHDADGQTEIDVSAFDRVQIQVVGHGTEGNFELSWTDV